MIIEFLAAAEVPKTEFGFMQAMEEGGPVAWTTAGILAIMLFFSLYILLVKLFEQNKVMKQGKEANRSFWRTKSLREGTAKLEKNSAYKQLVDDAIQADEEHAKLTDPMEAHDWLHGSLTRSEDSINAKLAGGLPFLATVGATAPFIGLFGTVVGIYRALIKIGAKGSAAIGDVAGPVGEALIMTAFGLLVAVPAVLAYNWLQSRNKRIAESLHSFSTDLLAYIASDGKVVPETAAPAAAKKPAPAAKPAAAKPAATTTPAGKK
ncbi:MotA/TolQ/ExbB proton channel family protein [Alterisphingorhabdus coralli]|uniref:Biopolymer transport protein ExbB n=1 Tax=Alterisphingorhabdus coralli TaxID=3071408 RepID=A0AA97I100_9SPHN|nr:MotA/TolQ/ExbB proton channel family protein [Parasphingorhabdus sp. SCSIO 66989]WOE74853.1 MotA/TolQ/ExbB proton channel family protein [Parasphingorhabdus sp. SCSIO 66989]